MITSILEKNDLTLKKKTVNEYSCPCPFCSGEDRFCVWPEENRAWCRGCGWKGDDIQLLRDLENMTFKEAAEAAGRSDKVRTIPPKARGQVTEAFPQKGKAFTLPDEKEALEAHDRLLKDPEALDYVTKARGISEDTLKHFKLGFEVDDGTGVRWLTIPHYEKGKLVNIKSRRLPPIPPDVKKRFKRVEGCRSILFNGDILQDQSEEIFIAEGELDAITLWDRGIKNVVSGTTGAGSFEASWIDALARVKKVFILYDPDETGQRGARELARRLGYDRAFNVLMPYDYDLNDFFVAGFEARDFRNLIKEARQFDIAGILSFREGLEDFRKGIEKGTEETGLRTGWHSVDSIIKTGFMPGELGVLSAPPKIGKSSFGLQITTYSASQGIPSLFFCLEMRPRKLIEKIVQCFTRREKLGASEIQKAEEHFKDKPLYLGYSHRKPALDEIMDTLKAAVRRYGLKFLCFDHLHFLCRSITNQTQEVGLAVQNFKFLAEEMEIPILLIAQPRKIQTDAIMTAMDLKDSSSIFSDCDHLIILHRQRTGSKGSKDMEQGSQLQNQAFEPVTLVRVEASRYNPGGETLLYFHGECSRFDEVQRSS